MDGDGSVINKNWQRYHSTKDFLLMAIEDHQKSIAAVNIYNNGSNQDVPLNTSGDWSLFNEEMGIIEMKKLTKKLTKRDREYYSGCY